jgi:dipeptidyl aminopeptidase/acylaminoacyl peptidase
VALSACADHVATRPAELAVAVATEAAPGEVVALRASAPEASQGVGYRWSQVGGPRVDLGDEGSRFAHFVMPLVAESETLTFQVEMRRTDGEVRRERHRVTCARDRRTGDGTHPVVAGDFAVFTATKDLATRIDLYLARLDGSEVFRLNGPLAPGGAVTLFAISPDRRHVAYVADQDTRGVFELYVARTDGGGFARASGPMIPGGSVRSFRWAPDGSRIAYTADQDADEVVELYASRADGSDNRRLSGPMTAGGGVFDFAWAPDAAHVAYAADQFTYGVRELFTCRPDGSRNARASGPLVPGGSVGYFEWAPDGSRVA